MRVFRADTIVIGRDEMRQSILHYGRSLKTARDELAVAYRQAIADYAKAQDVKKAKALEAERIEIASQTRKIGRGSYVGVSGDRSYRENVLSYEGVERAHEGSVAR